MRKYTILLLSLLSTQFLSAQIHYSSRIPKEEIAVLNKLKKALKETDFSTPQFNSDTFKLTTADSVKYAGIYNAFFDTSLIKSLEVRQTYLWKKKKRLIG